MDAQKGREDAAHTADTTAARHRRAPPPRATATHRRDRNYSPYDSPSHFSTW